MKTVEIISGTYGYVPDQSRSISPVSVGGICIVSDSEAARLVALGVACIIQSDPLHASPPIHVTVMDEYTSYNNISPTPPHSPPVSTPIYNTAMKVDALRAMAKNVGITFPVGTKKEQMVDALDAYFRSLESGGGILTDDVGGEGEPADDFSADDDGSAPPEPTIEEPVT